jgi:hypothetical protein
LEAYLAPLKLGAKADTDDTRRARAKKKFIFGIY